MSVRRPAALPDTPPLGITLVVRVENDDEMMKFDWMVRASAAPGNGAATPFTALMSAIGGNVMGGTAVNWFAARPDQFAAPPPGVIGIIIGPKA